MTEQELSQSARLDKRMRVYLILGIILSLLILPVIFSILFKPVIGLIVAGIWGTVSVVFIAKYKNKLKEVKEEIRKETIAEQQAQAAQARQQRRTSPVGRPQQTAPVRQQQSVTEQQQAIVDGVERLMENPIVKVATTYAVGKAATEAVKKTGIGSGIVNGSNSKKYKETIINDSITRQLPGGGVRIPVKSKADGNFGITLYLVKMPDGSETLITSVSRVVAKYDPVKGATYTGEGKRIGNGNQLHTLYKKA